MSGVKSTTIEVNGTDIDKMAWVEMQIKEMEREAELSKGMKESSKPTVGINNIDIDDFGEKELYGMINGIKSKNVDFIDELSVYIFNEYDYDDLLNNKTPGPKSGEDILADYLKTNGEEIEEIIKQIDILRKNIYQKILDDIKINKSSLIQDICGLRDIIQKEIPHNEGAFWDKNIAALLDLIDNLVSMNDIFIDEIELRKLNTFKSNYENLKGKMSGEDINSICQLFVDLICLYDEIVLRSCFGKVVKNKINILTKLIKSELEKAEESTVVYDTDLGEEIIELQIDKFTDNKLSELKKQFLSIEEKINNNSKLDQLFELEDELIRILNELSRIYLIALNNNKAAVLRQEVAFQIGDVLGVTRLMIHQEGGFKDDEFSKGFIMSCKGDATGEEYIIVIEPEPDEFGVIKNKVTIHSELDTNNADERKRLFAELAKKLHDEGVPIGEFECPDPKYWNSNSDQIPNLEMEIEKVVQNA